MKHCPFAARNEHCRLLIHEQRRYHGVAIAFRLVIETSTDIRNRNNMANESIAQQFPLDVGLFAPFIVP